MHDPAVHFFDLDPEGLARWCDAHGMASYRARQIAEWVYSHGVADPARMTNLSAGDRRTLAREMVFLSGRTIAHQVAGDGTEKLLVQWDGAGVEGGCDADRGDGPDGDNGPASSGLPILERQDASRQSECVLIPADSRRTACISSQIGCPVGCRFCASGIGGLDGNLSTGRIVEQVWRLRHMTRDRGGADGGDGGAAGGAGGGGESARVDSSARITNVVFMGMGEPLANLSNVIGAVRRIAAPIPEGLGISARKITISTVGLPRAIERLADQLDLPVTLALSLHAPNDEVRRSLIPWARYTTIEDLLSACRAWFDKTGREITLEYILLGGVNDRPEHAGQLADLARSIRANVNLIRYNEVEGLAFTRPTGGDVARFATILRDHGVNTHVRASRGRDIAAACGQLRHEGAATGTGS